ASTSASVDMERFIVRRALAHGSRSSGPRRLKFALLPRPEPLRRFPFDAVARGNATAADWQSNSDPVVASGSSDRSDGSPIAGVRAGRRLLRFLVYRDRQAASIKSGCDGGE